MPAWAEILVRCFMAALGAYLQSQGHGDLGVSALGLAAVGDLPFRSTSTGASSGRADAAR